MHANQNMNFRGIYRGLEGGERVTFPFLLFERIDAEFVYVFSFWREGTKKWAFLGLAVETAFEVDCFSFWHFCQKYPQTNVEASTVAKHVRICRLLLFSLQYTRMSYAARFHPTLERCGISRSLNAKFSS